MEHPVTFSLQQWAADGFRDAVRLRNEPAFEPLYALAEFRAIVLDLKFPADPFAGRITP